MSEFLQIKPSVWGSKSTNYNTNCHLWLHIVSIYLLLPLIGWPCKKRNGLYNICTAEPKRLVASKVGHLLEVKCKFHEGKLEANDVKFIF